MILTAGSISHSEHGSAEMPLSAKGRKIKKTMEKTYGKDKGERGFYAAERKGNIKGVTKREKRK